MHRKHKLAAAGLSAVLFLSLSYLLGYNVLNILWQAGQLNLVPAWNLPLWDWLVLETLATVAFAFFIVYGIVVARRNRHRGELREIVYGRDE